MKKEGHPPYQKVLFIDSSTDFKFVCGSTLQPKEKAEFEGKQYPVYKMAISSASHPFFTGANQLLDSEGRVDKFKKRYVKKKQETEEEEAKVEAAAVPKRKTKKK